MEKVTLYLYDISQGMAKTMSMMFLGQQIDAIYHTSLVVYGKEYFYGGGICSEQPGQTPYGKPIGQQELGTTEIPSELFEEFLKEVSNRFTMEKYNLIENNCNMFTDAAAEFLVGQGIDKSIVNQGRDLMKTPMGKMIEPLLMQMQGVVQNPGPGVFK